MANTVTNLKDKAPITEALLDIRFQLNNEVGIKDLKALHSKLKDKYPNLNTKRSASIMASGPEIKFINEPEIIGYMFSSKDKKRVVQVRKDGFSFNWLSKYENWESMKREAYDAWAVVDKIPKKISRVALRYINLIEFKTDSFRLKDYLNFYPTVPDSIQKSIVLFSHKVKFNLDQIGGQAIVRIEKDPRRSKPGKSSIVFDIDVFRSSDINKIGMPVWDYFEKLRNSKNNIFFEWITKKGFKHILETNK